MRRFLRHNGLSVTTFALFSICVVGLSVAGVRTYNSEQQEHGQTGIGLVQYLGSGHFVEAVFENWESEFLQMAAFVVLTAILRQKGAPESKKLDGKEPVDASPRRSRRKRDAPRPVRRGGFVLKLYEHSLSLALLLLFVGSFTLHAIAGAREYSREQLPHGAESVSVAAYISTPRFWFESLQNWQSEFLSVGVLLVLSIFLRQKGSPQSKPVASAHGDTGESESGGDGSGRRARAHPRRRRSAVAPAGV